MAPKPRKRRTNPRRRKNHRGIDNRDPDMKAQGQKYMRPLPLKPQIDAIAAINARRARYYDKTLSIPNIAKEIGEYGPTVVKILNRNARDGRGARGWGEIGRVLNKLYWWYRDTMDKYPL
jgi:hypothetical protein